MRWVFTLDEDYMIYGESSVLMANGDVYTFLLYPCARMSYEY